MVRRLLQQPARLIDGGPIVRVILLEQRLTLDDVVAAFDADGGDQALLGWADLDEIRFSIALPGDGRGASRPEDGPAANADNRRQREQDENSAHDGPASVISWVRGWPEPGDHTLSGIRT